MSQEIALMLLTKMEVLKKNNKTRPSEQGQQTPQPIKPSSDNSKNGKATPPPAGRIQPTKPTQEEEVDLSTLDFSKGYMPQEEVDLNDVDFSSAKTPVDPSDLSKGYVPYIPIDGGKPCGQKGGEPCK